MIERVVLCGVFTLSGAGALLFETLWFRGAGLSFGNGVWAGAITLAAYMGGLALGNLLAVLAGHRVRRPIQIYAGLEATIAVAGLALVAILPALAGVIAPMLGPADEGSAGQGLLHLGAAFALMMVPTTAMGATLPLLVKALCDADTPFGRALGALYGFNTLGATLGALAGEWVLIESFGVLGTGAVAAGLDLAAAALSLALTRRAQPRPAPSREAQAPAAPSAVGGRPALLLAAGALAGATLLGAEVLWFRFLRLFFLDSESTFVVMLAVVLGGIALGGLLAAAVARRIGGRDAAIWAACLCGVAMSLSYGSFDPRGAGGDWYVDLPSIGWLSLALMLPTAIASGALFTFLGQAVHESTGTEVQAVAALTTANTTGAMAGALVAGFVLLPALGVERSLWVAVGAYAAALACLVAAGRPRAVHALAGAAVAAAVMLFPSGRMQRHLDTASAKFRAAEGSHTVATREGLTETLQILRRDWLGQPVSYRLMTNGFSMSDSQPGARRYMGLYAHWPAAVNPRLESALLISYGLGNTAYSLTRLPGLREIHVVDISRDILAHADVPYPGSGSPLRDPRVRVHVDDGRYFLQAGARRFDLITSEPPPPRAPGVVSLYTEEYFRLLHERLNDGGLVTYWLPVHDMTADDARAILRGFCNAFADCALWAGHGLNWMMTGGRRARPAASLDEFTAQWRDGRLLDELTAIGLDLPQMLGATFMADATQLASMLGPALPLTDNHPKRYSQRAPTMADYRTYDEWMDVASTARRFVESGWISQHWPAQLRDGTVAYFVIQPSVNLPDAVAAKGLRLQMLDAVLSRPGLRTPVLWLLGTDHREVAIAQQVPGSEPRRHSVLGAAALSNGDAGQATDHFETALRAGDSEVLPALLFSACRSGQAERARRLAQQHAGEPIRNRLARCWP